MNAGALAAELQRPDLSRRQPRHFAVFLIVLAALLVGLAAYTSALIFARQNALADVSRYNLTWLVSQAALEVSRFEAVVGAHAVHADKADSDAVQLRFDIVVNRVGLLSTGEVGEFIRGSPELSAIARSFRDIVAASQPFVDGIDQPDPRSAC